MSSPELTIDLFHTFSIKYPVIVIAILKCETCKQEELMSRRLPAAQTRWGEVKNGHKSYSIHTWAVPKHKDQICQICLPIICWTMRKLSSFPIVQQWFLYPSVRLPTVPLHTTHLPTYPPHVCTYTYTFLMSMSLSPFVRRTELQHAN